MSREERPVRSVERALALVRVVAHGDAMPLAQLAEAAKLVPSTAHRLLATLVDLGYVQQDPGSRLYGTGPGLLGLVSAAGLHLTGLRAAALPHMTELAAACGDTALLTVLDGTDVIFIDQVLGPRTIRMDVTVGARQAAHVTAAGKALLAWQPETLLSLVLDAGLQRFTPQTLTDPELFRRELGLIRRRGWATECEEHELGAACVAAPIIVGGGPALAALSVSGPTARLRPGDYRALGTRIRQAADGVAESLATPNGNGHA